MIAAVTYVHVKCGNLQMIMCRADAGTASAEEELMPKSHFV